MGFEWIRPFFPVFVWMSSSGDVSDDFCGVIVYEGFFVMLYSNLRSV